MVLGMSLSAFTTLHVIISLIAIVAGLAVMFGMLGSRQMPASGRALARTRNPELVQRDSASTLARVPA